MRDPLCFRDASKSDLPNVLRLYSQPGWIMGKYFLYLKRSVSLNVCRAILIGANTELGKNCTLTSIHPMALS